MTPYRKGQVKFGENIAIMIVFFILLAIALVFYGAWQRGAIKETISNQFSLEAIRIALAVTYLPEVVCSEGDNKNLYITENCFDRYKVDALARLISNDEQAYLFYEDIFHDSTITIEIIFPPKARTIIPLYDHAPDKFTEAIPTYIPIILKDPSRPLESGNSIAKLTVMVYR